MKIGIDIRDLSLEQYDFCNEFLSDFISKNTHNQINIYTKSYFDFPNTYKINGNGFLNEQFIFLKKLFEDKNDLVITFNDNFPVLYINDFIQVIPSIEKLLYPTIENSKTLKKYTFLNILKANLKNAKKILCFDQKTKKDINEKLNINEEKIDIITPFFYKKDSLKKEIDLQIDIKQRHCINGQYLIYDSGIGNNKNIKRLFEAIKNIDISIVFIGNQITNDIESRELVMRMGVKEKVIFAGIPEEKELKYYYKQSSGVIYPLLYSSFPLSLNDAVNFGCNILASEIDEIKLIFGENASYFSPISTIDIKNCIETNVLNKENKLEYNEIFNKYSKENFTNNLIKLCQI